MDEKQSDGMNFLKVSFWESKKKKGCYVSHHKGLTPQQLESLKNVKEGDRLIIYSEENRKQFDNDRAFTLRILSAENKVVELP